MDEKMKKVIQVASPLFSRKGIKAVTMTELASECGISKKTLYLYFCNKEDLTLKIIANNYETIRKQVLQIKEENGKENEMLDGLFRLIKVQSKILTPIFLQDLTKYHHRINRLVNYHIKKLINTVIASDERHNWYAWQLRHILRDIALSEEERQDLLDQINGNYKHILTANSLR